MVFMNSIHCRDKDFFYPFMHETISSNFTLWCQFDPKLLFTTVTKHIKANKAHLMFSVCILLKNKENINRSDHFLLLIMLRKRYILSYKYKYISSKYCVIK